MELRQLRDFLVLAEERNFHRAAERLHISQPPLTRQIRALEEELGTALFLRSSKGVELTEAGAALQAEAPNLLRLAAQVKTRTQLSGQGLRGRLDVGIFGSAVLDVIPRLLARFHAQRPEVQIELHQLNKAEQIEALRERRIHVGFNRLLPPEPDLVTVPVLRERLIVGLPKAHPLSLKEALSARDLDRQPLILYPVAPVAPGAAAGSAPLPGLAQQVLQALAREGAQPQVVQSVEDVLTCVALVAGGLGLCVTTASAASLQLPGVVYRPLRARFLQDIELSCVHRRGDASPVLAAFLALLPGLAAAEPG